LHGIASTHGKDSSHGKGAIAHGNVQTHGNDDGARQRLSPRQRNTRHGKAFAVLIWQDARQRVLCRASTHGNAFAVPIVAFAVQLSRMPMLAFPVV
jgi:hypothetical protein